MSDLSTTKQEKQASFLVGIILASSTIGAFISRFIDSSYCGVVIMILIWLTLIRYLINNSVTICRKSIYFIIYISITVLVSFVFMNGHIKQLAIQFFEYGLLGLLVSLTNINSKYVFKICNRMMLIMAIPCFILIGNSATNIYIDDVSMGVTYGIMPLLFPVIAHLYMYSKESDKLDKISYVFTTIITIILIFRGTRGFLICLLVLITFLNIQKKQTPKIKTIIKELFTLLLIIIIILNANKLVLLLFDILNEIGIHSTSVQKMVLLAEKDDIFNGRKEIYQLAWKGFCQSPFWGNGIGSFTDQYMSYSMPFIHNMILQLLYELGVFIPMPLFIIMINGIRIILSGNYKNKNNICLFIVLFSSSIPMLFLSSEIWFNRIVWLTYGYYLSTIIQKSKDDRIIKSEGEKI